MASYITLDNLKSALTDMKASILNFFYTKTETDNKLNQLTLDVNTDLQTKLDSALATTIPNAVTTQVNSELTVYNSTLDTTISDRINAAGIITSSNYSAEGIAGTSDLPTALADDTFTSMVNDLTTDGGVY
jgi:hypothetical protein